MSGDRFTGAADRGDLSSAALRHVVICAARRLFARAHSARYFGGFWFKVFSERGPC